MTDKVSTLFAAFAEGEAATTATAAEGGFFQQYGTTLILIVAMVAVFYFLILRPQKKREKETKNMRDSIKVGDEIITIGGVVGKVTNVKNEKITIISGESEMTFLKTAVSTVSSPEDELEQ